jgi:transglutaminase-like putative cysteine protease
MSTLLERPAEARRARARPGRAPRRRSSDVAATLRVAALIMAAILPFGRVFITEDWFMPLLLAALLPVGVSFVARRAGVQWWTALALQVIASVWYTALVLLPSTLWAGVIPTLESARLAARVAVIGAERIAVLPAPVYPEVPLLLLAIAGVWWVATSIDVLALRLDAPGKAIICATTLWIVPLAIVPRGDAPWLLAAPLLLAGSAVMLAQAERDFVRWGPQVASGTGHTWRTGQRQSSGVVLAVCAVVVGVLLAGLLPGFGDPPWYELRARSTTTLTDNPIVQLRTNLVATDSGAVVRVRSPEPVYLRSTALDTYSDAEVWETSGIEPRPLDDGFVQGGRFTNRRREVRVQVVDVTDGVLVPAPSGAVRFDPPRGITPHYDERTSTFTFGDDRLQSGQRYGVVSSRPQLNPDVVASLDTPAPARLTELPDSVPPEVGRLARRIVDDAGATTPFTQALAIQNELRTWEYSLHPPPGHSGVAMRTFLEQRVGYCEQFAGTMAVMLRTLGIPARVAVGFTPGTVDPDDPTLWTVSWANAHAWVEVRFGGEWLAFEPTPRSDGNVLVPSVSDLTPDSTARVPHVTAPENGDPAASSDFNIFDEREALQNRANQPSAGVGVIGGGAGEVSRRLADPTLIAAVVLLLVSAVLVLVALGRHASTVTHPTDRILAVRDRIGRLGHGLGVPAPPWETDREYLLRLAPDSEHTRELAAAVTSARYAPSVDADVADRAERAGDALSAALLADRPRWQRTLIRLRGDVIAGWRRVRRPSARPG